MTLQNAFENLATEAQQVTMSDLLAAIKETNDTLAQLSALLLSQQPRLTSSDQLAVMVENQVTVGIASNQDIRNITGTVAALTNLVSIASQHVAPNNLNNSGLGYIYDNLKVNP